MTDDDVVAAGDEGFTLIELLVAMSIFVVVLAIASAGMAAMSRETSVVVNSSTNADDTRRVFITLDRQVRYAAKLYPTDSGVQYRTDATEEGQQPTCTEWRVDPAARSLQMRIWAVSATPSDNWRTMATHLADPAKNPFTVITAGAASRFDQLAVHLDVERGSGSRSRSTAIDSTFVARNSAAAAPPTGPPSPGGATCPS